MFTFFTAICTRGKKLSSTDHKKTILVVDDSAVIRRILEKELTDAGYKVVTAANGVEALSILAWMEEPPGLITLDIDMPRMNGFEVCAKLKEKEGSLKNCSFPVDQIPIIFVSANDSLENRRAGFQLEVIDFISKPFPPGVVSDVVTSIINPRQQFAGQQVLVADDSPSARRIVAIILERLGVQVIEAENGLAALTLMEDGEHSFDMLITDYMMPEMRGDELCRLVRQQSRDNPLPIIIISAFDDQDLILHFFKSGATDYLHKPFIEEELTARLQSHLQVRAYARELEEMNERLVRLAERDGLTGLYNRRAFQEKLQALYADAKRGKDELCCLMCDLDHFKQINDRFGHSMGDLVLRKFADFIKEKVAESAIAARYGGEEFVVLLPGASLPDAIALAEEICQLCPSQFSDLHDSVTVSIGVAARNANGCANGDQLVSLADKALYEAKNRGRNQVCSFQETR